MSFLIHHIDDARREAIARDLARKTLRFYEAGKRDDARKSYQAMCKVLGERFRGICNA